MMLFINAFKRFDNSHPKFSIFKDHISQTVAHSVVAQNRLVC